MFMLYSIIENIVALAKNLNFLSFVHFHFLGLIIMSFNVKTLSNHR